MNTTKPSFILDAFYKSLPAPVREKTSLLYHHYRFPGHFFNTGRFENARTYFNFCKFFQPSTYLTRARYAHSLAKLHPEINIDRKIGYTFVTPQMLPELRDVTQRARDVFGNMALDELKAQSRTKKKPFLIQVPLRDVETDLSDSLFLRVATHPVLLAPIARYLGMLPVLGNIEFLYSPNEVLESKKSQSFHIDQDDYREVKAFLYVEEVTADSGPLCVIPASESREIYDRLMRDGKINRRNRKLDDSTVYQYASPQQLKMLTVDAGTMAMVDTASCWHYGSRPGTRPRFAVLFRYMTPFSSKLPWRWRRSSPLAFSRVTNARQSPLEQSVLGAR